MTCTECQFEDGHSYECSKYTQKPFICGSFGPYAGSEQVSPPHEPWEESTNETCSLKHEHPIWEHDIFDFAKMNDEGYGWSVNPGRLLHYIRSLLSQAKHEAKKEMGRELVKAAEKIWVELDSRELRPSKYFTDTTKYFEALTQMGTRFINAIRSISGITKDTK